MSETYPCHFCPYGFPHYSEEFETRANKRSTLVSVFHDKIGKQLTRNLTNSNSCKYFIDFPLMAYQFERAEKVAQLKETELEEVVGYVKAKGLWGKVEKRPDETEMIYCMRLMEWDEEGYIDDLGIELSGLVIDDGSHSDKKRPKDVYAANAAWSEDVKRLAETVSHRADALNIAQDKLEKVMESNLRSFKDHFIGFCIIIITNNIYIYIYIHVCYHLPKKYTT